jgi:hypothetical protein
MAEPLSDEDYRTPLGLLRRFAESDLDRWAAWKLDTARGRIYVTIDWVPWPGAVDENFRLIEW